MVTAEPATGWRDRSIATGARLKTRVLASRSGASADWVWALKRSAAFRGLAREADVLCSLDTATDAALKALPDLLEGTVVLSSDQWPGVAAGVRDLERWLEEVRAGDGVVPGDDAFTSGMVALPSALRPLDAVTETTRAYRARHGLLPSAEQTIALDLPGWAPAQRRSSGLAAQRASAELSLGRLTWETLDEAVLEDAADGALDGADHALDLGDPGLAVARLGDAMGLLFHRARHSEVPRSALVEDPAGFLRRLTECRTLALVRAGGTGPRPPAPQAAPTRTLAQPGSPASRTQRALVVTGAYGSFHQGVARALRAEAEVKIRDFSRAHPHLHRKVMDPEALPMVAALVAGEQGRALPWVPEAIGQEARATAGSMRSMLGWADVVFSDWADRSTVFISHLLPPTTRLVVRVHALDALDPWLHLTRWDRVERVIVVSEAMRSLVLDLLASVGAQVPVTIVDVITGLREMERPKTQAAHKTLGMIGWGRQVKDPVWALDLLDRLLEQDPAWRLVLVGPAFRDPPAAVRNSYAERLQARLASPALRDRVEIMGPTHDVAEPMTRVGFILSASLREGWHLGLVEGAASGAVPVVRNWPMLASRGGPRLLYPPEWVVDDLDDAVARIQQFTDHDRWHEASLRSRQQALQLFDPERVAREHRDLILRGGPSQA